MAEAEVYTPPARPSGLDAVGDVAWGTEVCQLFRHREDLLDTLVPFLRAGLDGNERCVWAAGPPLNAAEARAAAEELLPDARDRMRAGQLEIVDHDVWYGRGGDVMSRWLDEEARAIAMGWDGLRVLGHRTLPGPAPESAAKLEGRRVLALCTYDLRSCGADELLRLLRHHRFALLRRDGSWQTIASATQLLGAIERQTRAAHRVRLYHESEFPAEDVAAHLAQGLAAGEAAIALATRAHLDAIVAALGDPAVAEQLIQIDAEDVARIYQEAADGEAAADSRVGVVLERALAARGRVRAYGEVVSVMAMGGRHREALELEGWWRRRIVGRPVELLCGYSLAGFSDAALVPVFRDVCAVHLDVDPAEAVRDGGRRTVAELEQALQALDAEHRRRKDVTDHLARLQRLTTVLAESAGADEIAQAVVDELEQVFNADVALYVVGADGDELRLLAASRTRDQVIEDRTSPRGLSIGGLPLMARGHRLGVLRMVYRDGVPPGDLERALLDDYARQVAAALERARAFDEAQRARRRLQMMADAASAIARARMDLGEVLDTIVAAIERSGLAERCRVVLDAPPPIVAEAQSLAVPLRSSGELIGHLVAWRAPESDPFSTDDREVLHELADRCALAVSNAQLFERAREERQRAEEERQRAEAANRAKDEFLAMLGHELRNPLSPILTAVQLMRLRAGDVLAKERTIIERQVSHMVRLVDDLLDVSRIVRGKVELRRTPLELAQVVATAIETASPLLEERAHKLVTSVPSTGLLVEGDAARLAQVIANLLTNAAKYTPNGGVIEVTASAGEHERVALVVRDNGVGIEPALLPRIFENFVQGRQAIDRAGGGLGLGLAIARNLVEMHGGALRAESEGAGKGSTFILELPLLGGGAAARRLTLPPLGVTAGLRGRRLLVVDDNRDGAVMLAQALEAIGHIVRVAHDGPSALVAAASFRPEMALLDIGLPVMDGYELARRLRATMGDEAPRLIAITGYGLESDRQRSLDAGFVEHLVKPVDFALLERTLRRLAEG